MNRCRLLVFGAALGVVGVGLMAMSLAGAPQGLVLLQGAVGLVALAVAAAASAWLPRPSDGAARIVCCLALALMALPFLFSGIDGVQRWIDLGPIQVQPAAIALPLVAWFVAREPDDRLAVAALLVAGIIAVLQPDQQAAAGLAAVALCVVLLIRPVGLWWVAFGVSLLMIGISAFGVTLEPVAYVEQVLPRAFEAHLSLGVVVAVGLAAVPLLMLVASPGRRPVALALTALWIALAAACLSGTYPTPVLGYGLSWVLGFALSLGLAARSLTDTPPHRPWPGPRWRRSGARRPDPDPA